MTNINTLTTGSNITLRPLQPPATETPWLEAAEGIGSTAKY